MQLRVLLGRGEKDSMDKTGGFSVFIYNIKIPFIKTTEEMPQSPIQ